MIEAMAHRLQGKKQSDGSYMVLCPAHADKNPSLHVSEIGEKILVNCQAGCSQEAVISALKAKDLWPEKINRTDNSRPAGIPSKWGWDADSKRYVTHWTYLDEAGNIIGYTARFEKDDQKDIVPFFRRLGEIWKPGAAKTPRPLYNLNKLKNFSDLPVLVSEGEKPTDAASNFLNDYACISWPGGSNAVTKADWSPLKGRDVIIWPDADEPGQKAAILVQKQCIKVGVKSVKIVTPPKNVKPGWDLADAAEWTAEHVLSYIHKAKKTTGLPQGFTAQELLNTTFADPRWAVKDILPEGLNIIGGKPKAGKSILALNLALAISLGGKALQSVEVERGSVIYLALEDTPRRLKKRIEQMLQYSDETPANLQLFTTWPRMGQGGVKALDSIIKSTDDTRLIIIDTLAKIRPTGNANNNLYSEDYDTVSQIKQIADENEVSILLIHHLRKMLSTDVFDMFSGTFGLSGAADGLMVMARNRAGQMVFSLTGRDVEQQEFILEFDTKMLSWRLVGKAAEIQSTEKKQKIFDALKEAEEGLTPTNLANATGLKIHYIKKVLLTLLKEGSVIKLDRGIYKGTYGTNGTKGTNGTNGTTDEIDIDVPSKVPVVPEGVLSTVRPEPLTDKPLNHKVPKVPLVPNIPGDADAEYF